MLCTSCGTDRLYCSNAKWLHRGARIAASPKRARKVRGASLHLGEVVRRYSWAIGAITEHHPSLSFHALFQEPIDNIEEVITIAIRGLTCTVG